VDQKALQKLEIVELGSTMLKLKLSLSRIGELGLIGQPQDVIVAADAAGQ